MGGVIRAASLVPAFCALSVIWSALDSACVASPGVAVARSSSGNSPSTPPARATYGTAESKLLQLGLRPWLERLDGPLLDIGCGSGYKTVQYASMTPEGVEVHGVDANAAYAAQWAAHDTPARFTNVPVGQRLPFPDGHFAAVSVNLMLHHVPLAAAAEFVAEMHRVLRPGGYILLEEQVCIGPMQHAMAPLWDETTGTHDAYLAVLRELPRRGYSLSEQTRFMESYRYDDGEGLVDDILTCNPHLRELPDLAQRRAQVHAAFARVRVPVPGAQQSPRYSLPMPHRFEVWTKGSDADAAAARPLFDVDVLGAQQAERVALRDRKFLPGGADPSLPETVPAPTRLLPLLDARLHEVGAVLFRGLPLRSAEDFDAFIASLGYDESEYVGGSAPRRRVGDGTRFVMTASDDHVGITVEPHQELSYANARAPGKLALFCAAAARPGDGGQTTITDMRAVSDELDHALTRGVRELGLRYVRHYTSALQAGGSKYGMEWQRQIAPTKAEVEAELAAVGGCTWVWGPDDSLVTTCDVATPFRKHPKTGEETFWGQPHAHHWTYYDAHPDFDADPTVSGSTLSRASESDGARDDWAECLRITTQCKYGDGSPISDDVLRHIRRTIWRNTVALELEQGDVLIYDNVLAGHGRMGSKPGSSRRVLVALAEPLPPES